MASREDLFIDPSFVPLQEVRGSKQAVKIEEDDDESDEGSSGSGGFNGGFAGSEFIIPPELRHKQQGMTTDGHGRKFGGKAIGQRRPPEVKHQGAQQGKGLKSHPAFRDTQIGAADRNMTSNAQINTDSESKASERSNELNPKLQKALNLVKKAVQRFIPPTLVRR